MPNDSRDPQTGQFTSPAQDNVNNGVAAAFANDAARNVLNQAGIFKPEDLQPGRMDMGRTQQILEAAGIQNADSIDAAKALRDADYITQAGGDPLAIAQQQYESQQPTQPVDRLTQLQHEMEQIALERDDLRDKLSRTNRSVRRLRDLEAEVQQLRSAPPAYQQPQYVNPAQIGLDPQQAVTGADVYQLMMAQSQAFGNRITEAVKQAVTAARAIQGYSLTPEQEDDLMDANPWLESLPTGQREQAMMALAPKPQVASRPSGPPPGTRFTPQPTSQEDIMRARVRQAAFIPAPSRASVPEQDAHRGVDSARVALQKKYQEAISRPGGSEEALKILTQLGAGPVDDRPYR